MTTGNSSLLRVYSHFAIGASGGEKFEASIVVGEQREPPLQTHLANEEGNRSVLLPDNFLKNFVIQLKKNGELVPVEKLEFHWADQMSKYDGRTEI